MCEEANATINTIVDYGSHGKMYGNPSGDVPSESFTLPFCNADTIEPPLEGGYEEGTSEPVDGPARIMSAIWIWPMFLPVPVTRVKSTS